jgi:hypothetical protein
MPVREPMLRVMALHALPPFLLRAGAGLGRVEDREAEEVAEGFGVFGVVHDFDGVFVEAEDDQFTAPVEVGIKLGRRGEPVLVLVFLAGLGFGDAAAVVVVEGG